MSVGNIYFCIRGCVIILLLKCVGFFFIFLINFLYEKECVLFFLINLFCWFLSNICLLFIFMNICIVWDFVLIIGLYFSFLIIFCWLWSFFCIFLYLFIICLKNGIFNFFNLGWCELIRIKLELVKIFVIRWVKKFIYVFDFFKVLLINFNIFFVKFVFGYVLKIFLI